MPKSIGAFDTKRHDILVDGTSLFLYHDIIPTTRPFIAPPAIETKHVDIPGSNGILDLSTNLTGYPIYKNRTGSWEFLIMYARPDINGVLNTRMTDLEAKHIWLDRYNYLMSLFARNYGKSEIILADSIYVNEDGSYDKSKLYYYTGRLSVKSFKTGQKYSTITVDYDLDPFRYEYQTYLEKNDSDGMITVNSSEMSEILTVNTSDMMMYSNYFVANETTLNPPSVTMSQPVHPTISVWPDDAANPIEIGFVNDELHMNRSEIFGEGVHDAYRFTITPGCKFYAKGNGAIKIDWRNRAL